MLKSAENAFLAVLNAAIPNVASQMEPRYLEEPRGMMRGKGGVLARPCTVGEISDIIKLCVDHHVAVVPYGGGTGLVGGQVVSGNSAPLVLSLERMNAVRSVDPIGNTITVEAGMTLAAVQETADAVERMFPLSLASEGSCLIGGNLATNAGGVQVLRYGNMRDLCVGIEAVMPDGSIHHGLKRLRKDNTGYDLRNLLIGSEGTLGVITAAVLKLVQKPTELTTCFAIVDSPSAATELLARLQFDLDGMVSAFELMNGVGFDFLHETMPEVRTPFDGEADWMVLVEVGSGAHANMETRMGAVLEIALNDGLIKDVLLAQSASQRDDFWKVRETIPAANNLIGAISSHDISIPQDRIVAFIKEGQAAIKQFGSVRLNCFGHLGDGNLHYNVFPPKGESKADWIHLKDDVKAVIHDLVHTYDGSISAEHGIGRLKSTDLQKYGDPTKLASMAAIKNALDPTGIMNPDVILKRS